MQDQQVFSNQIHHGRNRIISNRETESDENNIEILIKNERFNHNKLSILSISSHSSLNNVEAQATSISSEALKYANSISAPPIIITSIPAFTSHSSSYIVHFFYVHLPMLI
ncbi:unnamed protein product [Rotaria sordida]|uniref:Uncharacterized protein n=1 Tax=Rotaria sordida TaxID=392033 RepID=A0A820IYK8_9BILA|nr:unnamed protein product [Rotaria sordida]